MTNLTLVDIPKDLIDYLKNLPSYQRMEEYTDEGAVSFFFIEGIITFELGCNGQPMISWFDEKEARDDFMYIDGVELKEYSIDEFKKYNLPYAAFELRDKNFDGKEKY